MVHSMLFFWHRYELLTRLVLSPWNIQMAFRATTRSMQAPVPSSAASLPCHLHQLVATTSRRGF
jgi:hypothetical protein